MSEYPHRPALFAVAGHAQNRTSLRSHVALRSVPAQKPRVPQQLGLVGVATRPDTLISVGMQGLEFEAFVQALVLFSVRAVFDLRVSPSFRGNGFSVNRIESFFSEHRIRYRRLTDFVLAADDLGSNAHVRMAHYASFLNPRKDALMSIREAVRHGPAALLGWERGHTGSEREVFADTLQQCASERFDLLIAP